MEWEDYYDKFDDWSESTQINRISQLTSFGSHEEIIEIVENLFDDIPASRLVKKAIGAGVRFTPDEIIKMREFVNEECMNKLVETVDGDFTQEQVESLYVFVDDEVYEKLEKRYCHNDNYANDVNVPREKKPGLLFSLFALAGMAMDPGDNIQVPRFRVGDRVRVRWRGQEGTIIDNNGGLYMVSMNDGERVDSFPESELEKTW